MAIDVRGLSQIRRGFQDIQKTLERELDKGPLMDAAQLVVVTAKIKAPVRRRAGGKLRDSIIAAPAKSRSGKPTVRIGPSKKSGISFIGGFMEFGTKFITARPFLRPALRENRRAINAILRTSIGKVVRSRTRGKPKRKKVL